MKVLLIQPAPPFPSFGDALPFGLASIASFLRKERMDVALVDLGKESLPSDFVPNVVGIGASTPYSKNAVFCSKKVKKLFPHAKIVFGGPHFTAIPENAFPYADAVIRGDGELAMLDICYNGISERVVNGTPIENLDDIPLPDKDLLDCIYKGRKTRLHIVGARGCPFDCVFCAEHSKAVRYHSVDYFIENLRVLAQRYHNDIFISDDIFTLNKERAAEICGKIIRMQLGLRLRVFGHINCFDKDLLLLMKQAGVHTISYGIESGNNNILRLINKKFTVDETRRVVRETLETGINVDCLYMIGNVSETEETVADTVAFALQASKERWCSFAIPFPGTKFYEVAEQYGTILTKDWDKYTNQNIAYVPYGLTKRYMRRARDTIVGGADRSLLAKIRRRLRF
ncbi:B12-binding domain-containing radical SAM protein [bacterium]|nr:B12-binding domain-containing radical SAM protein [bacterium]MCK4437264.1 B12-binding domain-containing radical SAM protein [bacterium]